MGESQFLQLKLAEAQHKCKRKRIKITIAAKALKNVYKFKYLGSIFTADGDQSVDVKRRIALAMARMGELRQIFNSGIKLALKLKIYKTAIYSILTRMTVRRGY